MNGKKQKNYYNYAPKIRAFINEDLLDELHQLEDYQLCPADILDTVYFL